MEWEIMEIKLDNVRVLNWREGEEGWGDGIEREEEEEGREEGDLCPNQEAGAAYQGAFQGEAACQEGIEGEEASCQGEEGASYQEEGEAYLQEGEEGECPKQKEEEEGLTWEEEEDEEWMTWGEEGEEGWEWPREGEGDSQEASADDHPSLEEEGLPIHEESPRTSDWVDLQ